MPSKTNRKQRTDQKMSTKGTREEGTKQAEWRDGRGETGQIHRRPPPRDVPSSLWGLLFLSRLWSEHGREFPLLKAVRQTSGAAGLS